MTAATDVRHEPQRGRFVASFPEGDAELVYQLDERTMRVHHTGVPPALEGRGIASALVQALVDHARAQRLAIAPLCSYVRAWMSRHPEHADLIER